MYIDEAALGCESQGHSALERLMAPVYSVKARPFLIDIEALIQLHLGRGFSWFHKQRAFDREKHRYGFARRNVQHVVLIRRLRLSDFDHRDVLQQIVGRPAPRRAASDSEDTESDDVAQCRGHGHASSPFRSTGLTPVALA